MKGAKGLYFGANNAVLVPVFFVHRRRRRHENFSVLKVPNMMGRDAVNLP